MGNGQSLLSVFSPDMGLEADKLKRLKRKRKDDGEKEEKKPRTAAVDETIDSRDERMPDGARTVHEAMKRLSSAVDVGIRPEDLICSAPKVESSEKGIEDLTEAMETSESVEDLSKAMKRLMSTVDVNSRPEDLICWTDGTKVEINEPKCIEFLNIIHDRIVELGELKQKSIKKRRKANWSELPDEFLKSVLKKIIPSEFDMVAFRSIRYFKAVCRSWRAAAISCGSSVPLPRTPWFLLHKRTSNLFDPIGRKMHKIRNVCDNFPYPTFVGSSFGWILILYDDDDDLKQRTILFNPISRGSIPIPDLVGNDIPSKVTISSNPSFNKNFVVVVECGPYLAYYKHGDEDMSWKMLTDYRGKIFEFYGDFLVSELAVWNFKEDPPSRSSPIDKSFGNDGYPYLVKSLMGEMLLVRHSSRRIRGWDTERLSSENFSVEKLNLAESKWENLQSLGEQSLFVFADFDKAQVLSLKNPGLVS